MTVLADVLMIIGALIVLLAAIGLHRFGSSYARLHAAGKASPLGLLFIAAGAGIRLGISDAGPIVVASFAVLYSLPLGVHMLFQATERADDTPIEVDELRDARERSSPGGEGW